VPGWFSKTISVDMPQLYLAKFALYFWRHVGTYCPNMANSETFFPIIWRFGVIEKKKKKRKRVICIIRTSTSFLLPNAKIRPKKKHIGCPVPAWFQKPISVDLPPRSL
jgi:hypothetical protein